MKKIKLILSSLLLAVILCITLVSCNGSNVGDFSNKIKSSIKEANTVNFASVITDGDVEVYKLEREILINHDNGVSARIKKVEYTLGSNFELKDVMTYDEVSNYDLNELFKYNLNEDYFSSFDLTDSSLKASVKNDKFSSFSNTNVEISGEATVEFILNNDKIESFTITYTTNSDRVVSISASYAY